MPGAQAAVADAVTAAALLGPFRIENLTDTDVNSFGKIAGAYGQQWTADLLRTWFGGDQPAWAYGGGQERPQWVADWLPGLCAGLHAAHSAGTVAAQRLLDLAWEWTGKNIRSGLALSPPSTATGNSATLVNVHSRIDAAELPVSHVTRRQGRPYTLVLNKTNALFAREQEARARDQADLEWLAAE